MKKNTPEVSQIARHLAGHAPRIWQRMLSGRRLNLVEPSPFDIEIEDIALGLSRNTRWNGQTYGTHAWSVAQHSMLVVEILRGFKPHPPAPLLLSGLLHDASEYVTHDFITPLKAVVGDVFKEVEDRLSCAIFTRFGLPARLSATDKARIKKADRIAAATEAVQLAGFTEQEVRRDLKIPAAPLASASLRPVSTQKAKRLFLEEFRCLVQAVDLERQAHGKDMDVS